MAEHGSATSSRSRVDELAGVGMWSLDLTTGVLTTNAAARALLGWPPGSDEPTLQDFLDAVHPQDRDEVAEHAERLIRLGGNYTIEHRALLAGGQVLHLRASACADRDACGRTTVLHGVTLDITDLRSAALEATRERDLSRAVLSSLTDGYFLSAAGTILEVNEALCLMTGFSEVELVGSGTPYPFWPPEQVEDLLALRRRLKEQGGGQAQTEVMRKDGPLLPVAVTVAGLPSVDGVPMWIVLLRDITDEREHARQLELRAASDPLTGVWNSRAFRENLRAAVLGAKDGAPLSLALIDIDHFKAVNDQHGHAVGDEVLVAVVERLVAATADAGTLARVGGEEFALLMPGADAPTAHRIVGAALRVLRDSPVPEVGRVTASAGVAQLLDGMDDDGLYRLADLLLYEAKARGRDQVR